MESINFLRMEPSSIRASSLDEKQKEKTRRTKKKCGRVSAPFLTRASLRLSFCKRIYKPKRGKRRKENKREKTENIRRERERERKRDLHFGLSDGRKECV